MRQGIVYSRAALQSNLINYETQMLQSQFCHAAMPTYSPVVLQNQEQYHHQNAVRLNTAGPKMTSCNPVHHPPTHSHTAMPPCHRRPEVQALGVSSRPPLHPPAQFWGWGLWGHSSGSGGRGAEGQIGGGGEGESGRPIGPTARATKQ